MSALAVVQGTDAWRAKRRHGIGSSDAPIITGDAPWGDLRTLWAVKVGILDEPDITTPRTEWGLRLEDAHAAPVDQAARHRNRAANDRRIASGRPNARERGSAT